MDRGSQEIVLKINLNSNLYTSVMIIFKVI